MVAGDSLLHDIKGGIELGALTVRLLDSGSPQVAQDNVTYSDQIKADAEITTLAALTALVQAWSEN